MGKRKIKEKAKHIHLGVSLPDTHQTKQLLRWFEDETIEQNKSRSKIIRKILFKAKEEKDNKT